MELEPRWKDDSEFATEIALITEDGARLQRFVPLAKGKPSRLGEAPRAETVLAVLVAEAD